MAPPLIDTSIVPEVPANLYALFGYGLTDTVPQESFFGHFKDEACIKPCETLVELKREIRSYMTYYSNY